MEVATIRVNLKELATLLEWKSLQDISVKIEMQSELHFRLMFLGIFFFR